MSAAALLYFADHAANTHRPPLAELAPTPALLDALRKQHLQQFWPQAVFAAVWNWATSGGGRSERVLERVRLPGVDPDPHVLCFGPALDYRFLSCFARAHAVVPYRVEGGRLYVYDPDRPRDRGRYVEFRCGGADRGLEFAYGRFRSQEGWGLTLVPASALRRGGRLLYEAVRQLKVARSV